MLRCWHCFGIVPAFFILFDMHSTCIGQVGEFRVPAQGRTGSFPILISVSGRDRNFGPGFDDDDD